MRSNRLSFRRWAAMTAIISGIFLLLTCSSETRAGQSAENVAVIVNGDSIESRTVANYYVDLRGIPSENVVVLHDVPTEIRTDLPAFRDKILRPLLKTLDQRRVAAHINVIAYSAGFPTAVRIPSHLSKIDDKQIKKIQKPTASITGLTYFYRFVLQDAPGYLGLGSNFYARGPFKRYFANPFSGDKQKDFERAETLYKDEKFAEAAAEFEKLFKDNATLSGIGVRAAECFARAEKTQEAIDMLVAAIRGGWKSATYLKRNPHFETILEDPSVQRALEELDKSPIASQGPIGFSSAVSWTPTGNPIPLKSGGIPYLCSCCLAVTSPRGSTLSQAVDVLKRSQAADHQFPSGRFSFGAGSDIRAKTRFPGVAETMLYLQENGFETEVYRNREPRAPGPIVGLMTGSASVKLTGAAWSLQPGAIAENLTSYGGVYDRDGHTKITEFLHAGAAMSSGTVEEPYAIQNKFPIPMLYGFYARGLTAIESFYQSVSSPYQLLIVGDPLTQPFAKATDDLVTFELIKKDGKPRVVVQRQSLGLKVPKSKPRAIELLIGGRRLPSIQPLPRIELNLPETSSGVINIRATVIGADRTEPRKTFSDELDLDGPLATPSLKIVRSRGEGNPNTIVFRAECEGADKIEIRLYSDVVATLDSSSGEITVDTASLGKGPLRFHPVATHDQKNVMGKSVIDRSQELDDRS